jgi:hypothetical protein
MFSAPRVHGFQSHFSQQGSLIRSTVAACGAHTGADMICGRNRHVPRGPLAGSRTRAWKKGKGEARETVNRWDREGSEKEKR